MKIMQVETAVSHQCPVCRQSSGTVHHAREMMLGTRQVFPYWECEKCGCVSLLEAPASFEAYYPSNVYYSFHAGPSRRLRQLRDRVYLSRAGFLVRWKRRPQLDLIRRAGLKKSMSLLDVGCGSGQLLADIRELGYDATGVDPFVAEDVRDRFGIRVERKTLAEVGRTYDIILFRHSLEHMPLDALRLARERVAPGGVCVVCIPVTGWAWQHYGTNWVQLDAPRHLFLHSRKSFEMVAAASGFRVDQVVFDSNEFQFWGSECYQRGIPLREATPPGLVGMLRMRRSAAELNRKGQGDAAQFYLRPVE